MDNDSLKYKSNIYCVPAYGLFESRSLARNIFEYSIGEFIEEEYTVHNYLENLRAIEHTGGEFYVFYNRHLLNPIGHYIIQRQEDSITFSHFFISRNLRGRGIGRDIFEVFLRYANTKDIILQSNESLLPFFTAYGFEVYLHNGGRFPYILKLDNKHKR